MNKQLSDTVRAALAGAIFDGNTMTLQGQLDRSAYKEVNEAIVAAGGKWNRKASCHLFEQEAEPLVQYILDAGELPPKNPFAFFETPPAVIALMIEAAEMDSPDCLQILEPSAGNGAIVKAIQEARGGHQHTVRVYEVDHNRAVALSRIEGVDGTCGDFLEEPPSQLYDRILMNPPFAVAGNAQAYIDHINHAAKMLLPGGILVAIAPNGFTFRTDKKATSFRDGLAEKGAEITELPEGAFKASGTGVRTVMIKLVRRD
jgi:hypothetical protein